MIHHVYANRSNIGDWLSARGIQALVGEPVSEHLCDEPFVEDTIGALRRAASSDFVLIGGGGLFMDYFTPFWERFADLADELRFAIWGAGLVDLKQESSRAPLDLLRYVAGRAELCIVRDELTRTVLGLEGLPEPVPCPSLAAVVEREQREQGLLHCANYTTVGAAAYEQMREVGQAWAARSGRVFRETANRLEEESETALEDVLSLYERSDVVLSSRLHGCIVALAMGRPVLAVSGDWKVEAFMEWAGLADWVLDLDELDLLELRLANLTRQPNPLDFVVAARAANAAAARSVLARAAGQEAYA